MRVSLGINNCFAIKRWPLPSEWAEIVSSELRLELVQHSLDLGIDDPDGVREACDRRGLRIDSVFTGLIAYSTGLMLSPSEAERVHGVELWTRGIHAAATLGATSFGGHVGSLSRADADDDERRRARWDELEQRLDMLSALAVRSGIDALLVENMACDREPSRMDDIEWLTRDAAPGRAAVSLCLDVGHQCVPGTSGDEADPYAWLRRLGRRAPVIHLQQTDAAGDHHWPFTDTYNQRGRIEARRVLEALDEAGAGDVSLILEVIPSFEADDREVLKELSDSVDYWKDAIGDRDPGLRR
jgi:sugar phosphate isomerase/epimerase